LPSLVSFLGDQPIEKITLAQLRAWRANLAGSTTRYTGTKRERPGRLSPYTLHQYVRVVRRFFAWCVEEELLAKSPAARLELPQLPKKTVRGISAKNREAIIAHCDNPRDLAICRMLADTGCRVGGVAGLKMDDLDLDNALCIVWEKGRGGSQKSRVLFLLPITISALKNYLAVRSSRCENVFLGRYGNPLTAGGIYQAIERTAIRAGVKKGFNPHNWRHGRIRGWLANGMPLSTASQLAGHSGIQVTGEIYGTFDENQLRVAVNQYS